MELLKHHQINIQSKPDYELVYDSWVDGTYYFVEENLGKKVKGLRPPQLGAIFAVLSHTKSDNKKAATIVMPTGTGKTEVILSIVVAGKFKKTLVLVPTDALRKQLSKKFENLGLLKEFKLISDNIKLPIISVIESGIKDIQQLYKKTQANVIVTTPSSLSHFSECCLNQLISECTHLIIDEAHHIAAPTWLNIKSKFKNKPTYQFTATPFRNDGQRVEGKIIFEYSLKHAQEDGYFKKIEFHPILEFSENKADESIAKKAISLLKDDLSKELNHILMARVSSIKRCEKVFEIYKKETSLKPIMINSSTPGISKIIEDINKNKHKIIVCVDMLGEGFDLPNLKISAIHDHHKSINIMLQFIGRFTRTRNQTIGDAKFVANIVNEKMDNALTELYQNNSDWNYIISQVSSMSINREKKYQELKSQFSTKESKLLDINLYPAISAKVYKLNHADWNPLKIDKFDSNTYKVYDSALNDQNDVLLLLVQSYTSVQWSKSREVFDNSFELYIAYYNREQKLLFIHSSSKDGAAKKIQELIAKNAILIKGEHIFRVISGFKRMTILNVGLKKNKKGLRFTMHTGMDINDQINLIESKRSEKSNIFLKGFDNGKSVTIGCSHKGKIWSMDNDSLDQWLLWCKNIGKKLIDDTIDTNSILKTATKIEELTEIPKKNIFYVEWPDDIVKKNTTNILIVSHEKNYKIIDCDLIIPTRNEFLTKEIDFILKTNDTEDKIKMYLNEKNGFNFKSDELLRIKIGRKEFCIEDYFHDNPPDFILDDTSRVTGNIRYFIDETSSYKYDSRNILVWNWDNIDISVESQTENKIKNSIQYHAIQNLSKDYDFIFDDDGSGEVADIVAIKVNNEYDFKIDLYHCKFACKKNGVAKPGARVDDVYQVIGQSIKSIKWLTNNKENLFERLLAREKSRNIKSGISRIEKGNYDLLVEYKNKAKLGTFQVGVTIVQPAISKEKVSSDQLTLIGAAEAYIQEISGIQLGVIASA